MHPAQPWNSYRRIAAQTAPPGQLVLMLMEGGIRALQRALGGFAVDDPAEANMTIHNNLHRAQEIIRELDLALNMERGGDCASTLHNLYVYFDRRLSESNSRKSREGVTEVISHLTGLRDAWATMLSQPDPATTAPAASPSPTLGLAFA